MKRISLWIGALLFAAPLLAQEQGVKGNELQKFEMTFNPYSYAQLDSVGLHGAGGGVAFHLNRTLAIASDFSLNKSADDEEIFSFRGGVRFTRRSGNASVFGHILVGGLHLRSPLSVTRHAWAGGAGGGIDVRARDWLTLRVIQGEYFPVYFNDGGFVLHGARFTTGFVFHIP